MVTNPSDRDRPQSINTGGDFAVADTAKRRVQICQHTTCLKDGSAVLLQAWQAQQWSDVEVVASGCMGNCGNGPTVFVLPDQVLYSRVRSHDIQTITARPLASGRVDDGASPDSLPHPANHPIKTSQSHHANRERTVILWVLSIAILLMMACMVGALNGWF